MNQVDFGADNDYFVLARELYKMDLSSSKARIFINEKKEVKEQFLKDHLKNVSLLSKNKCNKFNLPALGESIGYFHDIMKINPYFQNFLYEENNLNKPFFNLKNNDKYGKNHAHESALKLLFLICKELNKNIDINTDYKSVIKIFNSNKNIIKFLQKN